MKSEHGRMPAEHQCCTLALHLGAFIREKLYGGKPRTVITFVPPTSPAPFTYGLNLIEPYRHGDYLIDAIASDVPQYDRSLDALHEAEKKLTGEQTVKYISELRLIAEREDDLRTVHWFAVVCSEAPHRLEALLRTLNIYSNN